MEKGERERERVTRRDISSQAYCWKLELRTLRSVNGNGMEKYYCTNTKLTRCGILLSGEPKTTEPYFMTFPQLTIVEKRRKQVSFQILNRPNTVYTTYV
jgi:hypothetical protein